MFIAEVVMEGPVLVVDNPGIGRQIVPINGTSLSWNTFNFGVTLFKNSAASNDGLSCSRN
jgi:hypothetical protein